jgi:hypothetical protein
MRRKKRMSFREHRENAMSNAKETKCTQMFMVKYEYFLAFLKLENEKKYESS